LGPSPLPTTSTCWPRAHVRCCARKIRRQRYNFFNFNFYYYLFYLKKELNKNKTNTEKYKLNKNTDLMLLKGDTCNVSVIPYNPSDLSRIQQVVTREWVENVSLATPLSPSPLTSSSFSLFLYF
jgi:hypothetical protein